MTRPIVDQISFHSDATSTAYGKACAWCSTNALATSEKLGTRSLGVHRQHDRAILQSWEGMSRSARDKLDGYMEFTEGSEEGQVIIKMRYPLDHRWFIDLESTFQRVGMGGYWSVITSDSRNDEIVVSCDADGMILTREEVAAAVSVYESTA